MRVLIAFCLLCLLSCQDEETYCYECEIKEYSRNVNVQSGSGYLTPDYTDVLNRCGLTESEAMKLRDNLTVNYIIGDMSFYTRVVCLKK